MISSGRRSEGTSIAIVGTGRVGATTAYAALIAGLADTILLVDADRERAEGEAMDLRHGLPFVPPAQIRAGSLDDCREMDLLVLTAGAARKPGDTRLDLARRNLDLVRALVPPLHAQNPDAIWVVVSNPVDLVTRAVQALAGGAAGRVIGTGTILDTARLRALLAAHFEIDTRNVHASVIGEHGDSEVAVWSLARIANLDLTGFARAAGRPWNAEIQHRLGEQVRSAGAEVIKRKGATYFAVSLATVQLCRAILRDERSVLTVSTVLHGEQGLDGVAMSLPCLLGRSGRSNIIPLSLNADEAGAVERSAELLRSIYADAGGPA